MPEKIVSRKVYFAVFAALLGLTLSTYLLSLAHLGGWNIVLALLIAICKVALVALFFMHVFYASRMTRIIVLAGLFWLGILLTLTLSDYLTRRW